jgi:hypothetical protein
MGGGLLQLVAYGAQDAYITGNPHITFWKVLYKRHTNFAMEAFRVNFTGAPQYGQRVVAVINRNADLMYKTYLEVVLPDTQTSATGASYNVLWTNGGQRRLGYVLLKKIEVEIGGQIIDTHYGEWLYLWENLTSTVDNSTKLDSMTGGTQGGAISSNVSCGGRPSVMYIPLQFWFCRNPGLALPLIALQYHEVRINVTLSPSTDLVSKGSFSSVSAAASALPQLKDMSLYIDYIYLDVDERRRFAQQSHEYLIDQLQFGLQQTLSTANARIDLTLNHPVKELIWVFQDARKTDCGSTTTSTAGYTQPFSYDDIADRCRLQINGQDRFDERYGDYFWKVQPYQHHSGGGFWPARNEVNAINANLSVTGTPTNLTQTAALTLSGANSATQPYTGFTGTLLPGMILTQSSTTATIASVYASSTTAGSIVLTASTNFSAAAATAAFSATPGSTVFASDSPVTSTGTLVNDQITTTYQAANPINVYSFALQPEEHQPSGTCNFSRIDTTTLVFDSVTSGGAGTFPSKSYPYNFRLYAVNYNIFRVMSGMGGLAYSN